MSDAPEHVEHVIAQGAEPPAAAEAAEAAQVAVATAEAAASLAHATAAAAELEAAEQVAEASEEVAHIEEESDAWRTATENRIVEFGTTLSRLSESVDALSSREQTSSAELTQRLAALEQLLIESTEEQPSTLATSSEATEGESATTAGTEAAIVAGPAEVSGGISLGPAESSESQQSAPPRKKHRWI